MSAVPKNASILIPTRNDSTALASFLPELLTTLVQGHRFLPLEILILNDGEDPMLCTLISTLSVPHGIELKVFENPTPPFGFGRAIRRGIELANSESVVLMMADGSDRPSDLLTYLEHLSQGAPAVFGSRFAKGGRIENYPRFKWILNRAFNRILTTVLRLPTSDVTNAFKGYSKRAIHAIAPLSSTHFEITVELPLKILRAFPDVPIVPIVYRGNPTRGSSISLRKHMKPYLRAVLSALFERKA